MPDARAFTTSPSPLKARPTHRAYMCSDYDAAADRWHWTIRVHTSNHATEVARSIPTFPTEHDANVAGKGVLRQLRHAVIDLR